MMTLNRFHAVSVSLLLGVSAASGQVGALDQVSPATNASFNLSATTLTWQAQIKAGVAGQLEGIRVSLTGPMGSQVNVRVRKGAAPSANPALFNAMVTKPTAGEDVMFIDMTASNIMLTAGEVFVMETLGNGSGVNLRGSYVAPPGTPLYPEPLYLNGNNFADGGWRHGFETFMLSGASCYPDCNGDTILNLADFGCFQTAFATGNMYADCNGDTILNLADFGCFQTKFAIGCP